MKTSDALLDASDRLAARLARDEDPEPIQIEDAETTFAIGWKGHCRIEDRIRLHGSGYRAGDHRFRLPDA
jgi:hypothetical protein